MKLILTQDVDKLGEAGEVVTVKDGFGRNFLIPRGMARLATPGAIKAQAEEQKQMSRKLSQKKDSALEVAKQLEQTEVLIAVKVGEENRIFGTVTSQQLAVELTKRGFEVDRRKIELSEDIRMIGVYSASVRIHPEVTAEVKVRVVPESEGEIA